MPILHYIQWNPDPYLIHFGAGGFRWYSLFMISTLAIGLLHFDRLLEEQGMKWGKRFSLMLFFGFCGTMGARLGHVFFYDWAYFSQHPAEILMIWKGGLASHGSALGMLIFAVVLFFAAREIRFLPLLDRWIVVIPLGAGLIRLGNTLNAELPGKVTDVPWAFIFEAFDLQPRHPVTLYESISYFLFFVVLIVLVKTKGKNWIPGRVFGLVLLIMPVLRFLLEFFKDHSVGGVEGSVLNLGQLLSLPFMFLGIWLLVRKGKKTDSPG